LLRHQIGQHGALIIGFTNLEILRHRRIGLDRPDPIDATDRGHDDHVIAFQQRAGGRMAHPVDLFVDLGFLLDIGVGTRHIGLWLIIVIVADEIFHRVLGKELFELAVKLGGQRLVGGQDDGRALGFLDHLGHGECLAGAGRAQKHLIAFARVNPRDQFGDGRRLVASRRKEAVQDEPLPAFQLGAGQDIGAGGKGVGVVMRHDRLLMPQIDRRARAFKG
jgi:hypothetical protein